MRHNCGARHGLPRCSLTAGRASLANHASARFQKSSSLRYISRGAHRSLDSKSPLQRCAIEHKTQQDASPAHSRTARGIDARVLSPRTYVIRAALPRGIGEEKARGRGRLWRGRAVDAEDEEEGASAASYAVDASPPLTRRWPRRTRRRRTTSPASLDRGTRTTQTRTRPEHRSAAAR